MHHPPHVLQQWYDALRPPQPQARYNIAPGSVVQVLRVTGNGREFSSMRWGFVPSWADNPLSAPILHNARAETVAEKPMFRKAFRERRCLIPASGFYEWKNNAGKKQKQPYYITLQDGSPLSFAGLWEAGISASGEISETCAIVTTKANSLIEPIHTRMPVLLDSASWPLWLDAKRSVQELLALLQPYPASSMRAWEVEEDVNRAAVDKPELLLPRVSDNDSQAVLL